MTRVLFRCDASLTIGSGHIIRCRTLARELQLQGAEVLFLCRRQKGDLINLLEREFPVLELPNQSLSPCEELKGRELYRAWLGCRQIEDAKECLKAISSAGIQNIDWLVVDHYGIDSTWESHFKTALDCDTPFKLLVIDDLADRYHQADLLLDQNFIGAATDQRYQELVPRYCRELLGPHYSLLAPEYSRLRRLVPKRTDVRRILVFFGGVDKKNLTGRTIEALLDPALAHLAVDVVLGDQAPHRRAVERQAARRPFTTIHSSLPSLAGLIARADLAIGAGGATTWERACLKLPSLVVTIAANQQPFAEALDNAGYLKLLGDSDTVSAKQIRSELIRHISQKSQQCRNIGEDLTDGLGASRLAIAMLGPKTPIKLRRAQEDDEPLLLRWANDSQVRNNSFSPEKIAPSDHHHWFRNAMADPERLLLIALAGNDIPVGQIRFDRQHIPPNRDVYEAMVDLSIDRCARGHGLATDIVHLGLDAKEQQWGPGTKAVAEVLTSNAASNACFRRAGFILEQISPVTPSTRPVNRWHKA
jgi:UDP-2,4-diacetamido-2,4,6-trideoxy-beta-L-altropyranose hydrolase